MRHDLISLVCLCLLMSLDSINYDKRYVYKLSKSGEYYYTFIGKDDKD